jgi:hypothetical protein
MRGVILAKNTAINKPELLKAIAPSSPPFPYAAKKVDADVLVDRSIAAETKARLDREKPFVR